MLGAERERTTTTTTTTHCIKTDLTPAVEFKAAAPLFQYDREGNTKMEDPELLTRKLDFSILCLSYLSLAR
ncbi:hypothetical protein INR49_031295 [Caranx melampygus]|nr:hypothetical protein INR49_031295 [Caranx melampygus]